MELPNIKIELIPSEPAAVKISSYYKNLAYRKKWIETNRDKVNNYAKLHYIKKLNEQGDNYRALVREKNKKNYHIRQAKINETNLDIAQKTIGRPRTRPILEIKDKKACGRPRKYILDEPPKNTNNEA